MPPKRKQLDVNPSSQESSMEKKPSDPTALVNPVKTHKLVPKVARPGWCNFKAKGRCYVEGALLEDADQTIALSPAGSYRQRNNKNLELVDGEIPAMAEDAPERPHKNDEGSVKRAFVGYENSFVDSLEDGDPRVGAAPGKTTLIRQ